VCPLTLRLNYLVILVSLCSGGVGSIFNLPLRQIEACFSCQRASSWDNAPRITKSSGLNQRAVFCADQEPNFEAIWVSDIPTMLRLPASAFQEPNDLRKSDRGAMFVGGGENLNGSNYGHASTNTGGPIITMVAQTSMCNQGRRAGDLGDHS
jgi:hypothetical protein